MLWLEQTTRLNPGVVNVKVDADSNRSNDDENHDDHGIDVVGPKRGLETSVGSVDRCAERNDQRSDGRIDTAERVDSRTIGVEFDKHEAEHESDKNDGGQNTDGPAETTSDVLRERETIWGDSTDEGSEPGKEPKRDDGRKAVGREAENTGLRNDGELRITEEER